MKVLSSIAEIKKSCNYINRNNCPLGQKCVASWKQYNYKRKVYIGTTEANFKQI